MLRRDIETEKVLLLAADMQSLGNVRDKLTRVIDETLLAILDDRRELDEFDLELVRAAALPSYQQFSKKYLDDGKKSR